MTLPILNSKTQKWKKLTIPWSPFNEDLALQAKEEIKAGELGKALDCLSKIEVPALEEEVTQLSSQLAHNEKLNRQGVLSHEKYILSQNRLSKGILELISSVEMSLQEEGEINTKIKAYLSQRYQNRLDQKLAGRQPINLRKLPSSEGTSNETSSYFVTIDREDIQGTVHNIFEEAKGRLLITGLPGSGKTVLMLQLVLALLEDKTPAIPVVLNLATWQSSYGKLEGWLEKILPHELGVNSILAKRVLKETPLILLLDGLDEVKEADRRSCLEAIGSYGSDAQKEFVIASRKQEYINAGKDAPVYLQVEVEPLKLDQIETELQRIGYQQPEALPLLNAIKSDELIKEVVKIPFYFNVLQLLFAQGKRLSDLNFSSRQLEGLQEEIIHRFIHTQLDENAFKSKPAQKWLAFLASRMKQRNLVVFELRDMQFDWWSWSNWSLIWGSFFYVMISIPIFILIFFLIVFVAEGFSLQGIDRTLFLLLLFLPVFGVVPAILRVLKITSSISNFKIETRERIDFKWKPFLEATLSFFIIIAPVIGLFVGLNLGLETGLLYSLSAGLLFSLLLGLGYIMQKEYSSLLQINHPYQRFYASLYRLHFSILLHIVLRVQLYQQGVLPLKLVRFLNSMSSLHIMESDGATWRFRHRIIQDYFAEQWDEKYSKEMGVQKV